MQKPPCFFSVFVSSEIGHGFPKIFGFIGLIDGDGQGLDPEIILEPVCHVLRRHKAEGRDSENYTRRGHAGAIVQFCVSLKPYASRPLP